MNNALWIFRLMFGVILFTQMGTARAGAPMWTFTPLTATTLSIPINSSATVQYTVTNQSRRTRALSFNSVPGISQTTAGLGVCGNPFTLAAQQSCVLTLEIAGNALQANVFGGPKVCQQGSELQCYQPSISNCLNITRVPASASSTLTSSVSNLVLSVNNSFAFPALTGSPRRIIITNTGNTTATNVTYQAAPALPAGTTISPASCGTVPSGGSCLLIVTPGSSASLSSSTLTVQGDNTNALPIMVDVLEYNSIYQSGYVFSIDDTTPSSGSIGAKIAALNNQVDPLSGRIWSSDALGNSAFDAVSGIAENSTFPANACNGATNGACNTNAIVNFYPAINFSFYAAGACKATIGGYSDWYLPAICELGYDTNTAGTGCGSQVSPTIQNMQSNLVDNGGIAGLSGNYWSSTQRSAFPNALAWYQDFGAPGGPAGSHASSFKSSSYGVRCVRAITP